MGTKDRRREGAGPIDALIDGKTISKTDLYLSLANGRRRALVRYLLAHGDRGPFDVSALADEIAAWERETTTAQIEPEEHERVRVAFHHKHLPAMDDQGLVDYDRSGGIVTPTRLLSIFEPYVGDGLHDDSLGGDP